ELIITHHPLIYNPIKNITYDNVIARLIRHNISVISCHSNLDAVKGGVNDQLIQGLDLTNIDVLSKSDNMGRIGKSKSKMTGYQLALKLKAIVRAPYIQVINGDKSLRKIAVVSGSGGSYMDQALEKRADAFVTGEVKHDQIIYALNNNLVLIILGHHYSERVVLNPLKQKLQAVLNEILFVTEDNFEMRYL
ncbi:MAG: Nif3-like dinuclear metal center hexameric protein, partial [Oscillospiraceae bacterium]